MAAVLRRVALRRLVLPLAVLLLLQWSAAFGHCRALRAEMLAASVICMSHGDGAPVLDQQGPDNGGTKANWDCPACHQLPVLARAEPPRVVPAGAAWAVPAVGPKPSAPPALGARAPPPPARAPPFA